MSEWGLLAIDYIRTPGYRERMWFKHAGYRHAAWIKDDGWARFPSLGRPLESCSKLAILPVLDLDVGDPNRHAVP